VAPEPGGGSSTPVVADDEKLPCPAPPPAGGTARSTKLPDRRARLAKENPAAVANIVRGWVNGETA
jgi:flagellar M-ring protein FliF